MMGNLFYTAWYGDLGAILLGVISRVSIEAVSIRDHICNGNPNCEWSVRIFSVTFLTFLLTILFCSWVCEQNFFYSIPQERDIHLRLEFENFVPLLVWITLDDVWNLVLKFRTNIDFG